MSKKLDYSKFSPAVLSVLDDSDEDTVIQPIKRSPVEVILFSQELRERSDAIIEKNKEIEEKKDALSSEINEMNEDLKEKENAINEIKMKKAEKVDTLWVLHAQLKEHDRELNQIMRQFASLLLDSSRSEKNGGEDDQDQDGMNQLDKDVASSSRSVEQEVPAMIDNIDLEKAGLEGAEEQHAD